MTRPAKAGFSMDMPASPLNVTLQTISTAPDDTQEPFPVSSMPLRSMKKKRGTARPDYFGAVHALLGSPFRKPEIPNHKSAVFGRGTRTCS